MGIYWGNGKQNGNYFNIIGYILVSDPLRPFQGSVGAVGEQMFVSSSVGVLGGPVKLCRVCHASCRLGFMAHETLCSC